MVTGGAGFIGSNLVEALIEDSRVSKVKVLDDLSTGFYKNIEEFTSNPKFEFVQGDIRNLSTCMSACEGIDLVSHQAALGSVPRSIKNPLHTHDVNLNGTLNVMQSCIENKVERLIFAASSSTYGDSKELPKVEDKIGKPLSPYAVTKFVNEVYADVYNRTYGLRYVGLRYFNIFGPKQDPNGAYAAVIPLFFKSAMNNTSPVINGDGSNSRDFTYVKNAVEANMLALFTENENALNQIYNIACGNQTTLKQLWEEIAEISKTNSIPSFGPPREGDIPHSLADISKAKTLMGYDPKIDIRTGLEFAYEWYAKNNRGA